jgi:putative transposase
MLLTEKHQIKLNHNFFKEIDASCFQSKNLYNSLLYIVRQYFFEHKKYIGMNELYKQIKLQPIWNECGLAKKLCNQVLIQVDTNYKAFFAALKSFEIDPSRFNSRPKIPKYKEKLKGKNILTYPKDALYVSVFKKTGCIKLSNSNIVIKTQIKDWSSIKSVRVVPKNNRYDVEISYEVKEKEKINTGNFCAIDLGVNNLATIGFDDCKKPISINGKPLKSINQYYNKKKAKLQSQLKENQYVSKKIKKLTNKRNNKINDYMHKASRLLVNQLVSRNISNVIIGYNQNWKQDINIGKKNNQTFVNIPFLKFIDMVTYKCQLEGIEAKRTNESYTSKCSFLDGEEICKHDEYKGKRIKRGLFKSKEDKLINADLNGAYNILKKEVPKFKGIEDVAVHPKLLKVI